MASTDDPSLKWCVWFLAWHIFNHVKLRMYRLTGKIEVMNTGAIEHFWRLTRWYLASYWNRAFKR